MEMIFLLIVAGLISGYRVSNSFIIAEADVAHFIVASFALFFSVFRISFLHAAPRSQIRSDAALQSGLGVALLTCNTGCQLLGATWLKHDDHGASRHVLLTDHFVPFKDYIILCTWSTAMDLPPSHDSGKHKWSTSMYYFGFGNTWLAHIQAWNLLFRPIAPCRCWDPWFIRVT